jgi:hypothetical protein
MKDGPAPIADADIDARVRLRARRVYARSVILPAAITALAPALPNRG